MNAKKILKKFIRKAINFLPKPLKYALFRRLVQLPDNLSPDITFKLAETKEELESAFGLLHDSYVEVGLMKPDPSGLRVTAYHALPSTITIIGISQKNVVATLTIIRDSPLGLPSDNFVDLKNLRLGGARIAEISALAIQPKYRGRLLFYLLKHMYEWCVHYLGVDHLIAVLTTDSKSHELYESVLFFNPIEGKIESNYSFSNFRPVIAEHLDLNHAYGLFKKFYNQKEKGQNLYSFFTEEKVENLKYPSRDYFKVDYPVMNLDLFNYFFIHKTMALKNMTETQVEKLKKSFEGYPLEKAFKKVSTSTNNIIPLKKRGSNLRFNIALKAFSIDENGKKSDIQILDISEGGIRITSKEKMADAFTVIAFLGKNKISKIQVKKIWMKDDGVVGLSIEHPDENWFEMLDYFHKSFTKPETPYLKKLG